MRSKKRPYPTDLPDHILDIAEDHFGQLGYEGTSLRGIMKDANTNVASIAYHFGSKEDLYKAVTERFALPVVHQQLSRLRIILEDANPSLEQVLISFYAPPLQIVKSRGERGKQLAIFLGRAQTEMEPVFSMVDKNYAPCREEYIRAFERVLPGKTNADYQWMFEFMLALIVSVLTRQDVIIARYDGNPDWQPEEVLDRLVLFCASGFRGMRVD